MSTETITHKPEAPKRFSLQIVYNGIAKSIEVQPHEQVTALLAKAISAFNIAQNPHLLSLYREDGTLVAENGSIQDAGIIAGQLLLLRPNAVKGGSTPLKMSDGIVRRSFEILRCCGESRKECVVYWVGPSTEPIVDAVEHPVHRRSAFGYQVDDAWLTHFFLALAKHKRSVKAQVHTHPGDAFHSAIDDHWPIVSQVGFLSVVIPYFASGPAALERAWIGRLDRHGWSMLPNAAEAFTA